MPSGVAVDKQFLLAPSLRRFVRLRNYGLFNSLQNAGRVRRACEKSETLNSFPLTSARMRNFSAVYRMLSDRKRGLNELKDKELEHRELVPSG